MKAEPFWREAAPLPEPAPVEPPATADVAVIGGGLTGLSAALALAEAGRSVALFEAGPVGGGASSRNGGMIGWGHRARLEPLAKRFGRDAALAILAEARRSYEFTTDLIKSRGIDCRFQRTGRYLAAASPRHFERLAREMTAIGPKLGFPFEILSKADQTAEIATEAYAGGVLLPSHGMLHPGLLTAGLADTAATAGVALIPGAPVSELARQGAGWRVATRRGATAARDVALAVNGYVALGGRAFAPFARGVIPLPSTIIATEPIGANRMRALTPGGRAYVDTRSVHSYFRADPDGERILWGGRASLNPLSPEVAARRLRGHMASVFPELRDVGLTHSWAGNIAYTLDVIPQIGRFERGALAGAWYAGGYCGSGVAMAPYLGWRMAQKILDTSEAATGFDAAELRTVPAYRTLPLALAGVELWHKALDWRDGVRPAR